MKLARIQINGRPTAALVDGSSVVPLSNSDGSPAVLSSLLAASDIAAAAGKLVKSTPIALEQVQWLPVADQQEVWAAGVTYKRSQTARMEESEAAASCYDRVYTAARPEIFFKATPSRCSGHLGPLRIRVDATWNVPEPELALVINPSGQIVGYTIGNDMSSRDIEGDNPLYLPQAKCYNQCCGIGPWVTLASAMPERNSIGIRLKIERSGKEVFTGTTSIAQMARQFEDLVQWLFRDNDFPHGAFLLTGTGIVPDSNFTLNKGDVVTISIDGIGDLQNTIVQGA